MPRKSSGGVILVTTLYAVMESTNGSVTLNVSVIRREIYSGPQVSIFFVSTLPTVVLSVLIILSLLVAKDIKWKMSVILINILGAEVILSFYLGASYLGYPIRQMLNLSDKTALILCRFQLGSEIIGTLAKLGTIMFYSVMVYVFIKKNIDKVRWFVVILPLVLIWTISLTVSTTYLSGPFPVPVKIIVFKGFCNFNFESVEDFIAERMGFLILLVFVFFCQVLLCGVPVVIFSILIFRYMKLHLLSENDKSRRAIAKNLLFLSVGALLSIINGIVYTIILFITLPDPMNIDVSKEFVELSVRDHVGDLYRSFISLYTPVVTVIIMESVRDALLQLLHRCCYLTQQSS